MDDIAYWQATWLMRLLDWLEAHTTDGRWPWGKIWLWHGFSFHFASGVGGFAFGFGLPRWLPGFVTDYQVDGPRRFWRGERCPWWQESNLSCIVPLLPPGMPSAYRTRRPRPRRYRLMRTP